MNAIDGNQAATILYQFLGEASLAADSREILTHRDELLPLAFELLADFHANPRTDLSAYALPVQHAAVLLINLLLVDLMQRAETYSARLPENLSLREQAAFLIGREIGRYDRQHFMKPLSKEATL